MSTSLLALALQASCLISVQASALPDRALPPNTCTGVDAWVSGTAYQGGAHVRYNGDLWTAKWWSYNNPPGDPAQAWVDEGACPSDGNSPRQAPASSPVASSSLVPPSSSVPHSSVPSSSVPPSSALPSSALSSSSVVLSSSILPSSSVLPSTPVPSSSPIPSSPIAPSSSPVSRPSSVHQSSSTPLSSLTPSSSSILTSSPTPSPSPSVNSVQCSEWARDTAYQGGDKVKYNGNVWTAKWWSFNNPPGDAAGAWNETGSCEVTSSNTTVSTSTSCNGTQEWASNTAYQGGDKVGYNGNLFTAKWWNFNNPPGDAAGAWTQIGSCNTPKVRSAGACAGVSEWASNTTYQAGTHVTYVTHNITDLFAANTTSYNNPPGEHSQTWTLKGPCTSSGRKSRATDEFVARDQTQGAGQCAGVGNWIRDTAYVGGSKVQFNGRLFTAKWWSFNNPPGDAAQAWIDNGAC